MSWGPHAIICWNGFADFFLASSFKIIFTKIAHIGSQKWKFNYWCTYCTYWFTTLLWTTFCCEANKVNCYSMIILLLQWHCFFNVHIFNACIELVLLLNKINQRFWVCKTTISCNLRLTFCLRNGFCHILLYIIKILIINNEFLFYRISEHT